MVLSLQGCMAVGKTTAVRYLQENAPYVNISYEINTDVVEEVKKYFRNKVYTTVIPRNVRLAEAPSYGMPIMQYDPRSAGAVAYQEFAEEFLSLEEEE